VVKTATLEKQINRKRKKKVPPKPCDYLSTGSTELNLGCSGSPFGALLKGKYYGWVGDSQSGKTIWVLTLLAEAANNPSFNNYRLIFDDVEGGALFDMSKFFGKKMASRLEPPRTGKKGPLYSETVEELYYNIDDCYQRWQEDGKPFIYIVDSIDALTTLDDEATFQKRKKATRSNTEAKGSYGAAKPKLNSMYLRKMTAQLRKSGSIVVFISQSRDGFSMFEPKTRSGGKALKFYATMEFWTRRGKVIKAKYLGNEIPIGVNVIIQIKKNRVKGKDRTVTVPIFEQFKDGGGGVDDIGACIEYLVKWRHWKKVKRKVGNKKVSGIVATEFDFFGTKDQIIRMVEFDKKYRKLQLIVSKVWHEVEDAVAVSRQSRYA